MLKTTLNGRPVILKRFDIAEKGDKQKFKNEALKLRGLVHPNIVRLESVLFQSDNTAYIHMAFQPGGDLKQWLKTQTPTAEQKQVLLHQVCRGIEYMHAAKVLHCDIKLENILMSDASLSARPLLADFDISKNVEERATETHTQATAVGGTFAYMAPEIRPLIAGGKGERPTALSDMYAFGVVSFLAFSTTAREAADKGGDTNLRQIDAAVFDEDVPAVMLLLKQLMAPNPTERLSASGTLSDHPALCIDAVVQAQAKHSKAAEAEAEAQKQALEAERARVREEALVRQTKADEKARALQRICCVGAYCSGDSLPLHDGIECGGDQKHFVCNDCFSGHVYVQSSTDDLGSLAERCGNVFCPCQTPLLGCGDSKAFTDAAVARHASAEVFECYLKGKSKLVEMKLVEEITASERERQVAEIARLATMSEQQREVRRHAQMLDELMNLRCPRSKDHVFGNLPENWHFGTECMVLQCQHAGCGCKFCGWCEQDCKGWLSAHRHVVTCAEKPGGVFFTTRAIWEQHRKSKLAKKVTAYIRDHIGNSDVRAELAGLKSGLLDALDIDIISL